MAKLPTKKDGNDGPTPKKPTRSKPKGVGSDPLMTKLDERVGSDVRLPPAEFKQTQGFEVMVTGTKNAGKTVKLAGVPCPNDKPFVFISFDDVTEDGLVSHYSEEWVKDRRIIVFNPLEPIPGTDYIGWDPEDIHTATDVLLMSLRMVRMLKYETFEDKWGRKYNDGVDNLVLDHWQDGYEKFGTNHARAEANKDSIKAKLQPHEYTPRNEVCAKIIDEARSVADHMFAVSGYVKHQQMKFEDYTKKDGSQGSRPVIEVDTTKWLEKFQAGFHNHLHFWSTLPEVTDVSQYTDPAKTSDKSYLMTVYSAKHPRFPDGRTIDMTDKNLGIFWEDDMSWGDGEEVTDDAS